MSELLIAKCPFKGTANQKVPLNGEQMVSLTIFNDASTELTFKAGFFEFTVAGGDAFDERLSPFETLEITASGAYRGYCRKIGN